MKKATVPIVVVLVLVCGMGGYAIKSNSEAAMKAQAAKDLPKTAAISKGDIVVSVVETGTIDAAKVVEVKGRVTGRLAKLMVDEGDSVTAGQLIATIDPKETQLLMDQDAAQLRGAESVVARSSIEIGQRRITAQASYDQAKAKVAQLKLEMTAQPTVTKEAIASAQTTLNSAVADRDRLVNSIHPTQRTSTQNALAEAKANYANALSQYNRQNDLFQKGYVSGRDVETFKLTLDLAKVRQDTAEQNLMRLESQLSAEVSKANESVDQAKANLRSAQANGYAPESKRQDYMTALAELAKAKAALNDPAALEKQREQSMATVAQLRSVVGDAQRQLGETEIKAPITGVVTKKAIQVGELATGLSQFSSGSTIVTIEDRSSMLVKLDINEIDMAKLRVGMPATINVDAIPDHPYNGIVKKIAPASKTTATGAAASADGVVKYEVEIQVKDADANLRSGMSAKCKVDVINHSKVLSMPIEYLVTEGGKNYVYIATTDPKATPEKRAIVIGAKTGSLVEIVSGLKEGEKVQKPKYTGPERKGFMQAGPDGQ